MSDRYFYTNMNQGGPPADMYYHQTMSAGPPPPQSAPTHYGHPQGPQLLHPGQSQYAQQQHYGQHYSYTNGLTSPPGGPQGVSGPMGPGSNVLPLPNVSQQGLPTAQYQQQGFDTTGQVAPPGMKPRVTATLWEDEGSLCFQVEARGICVARREDNHMINGTKLLNVAGMTRGRRDGILKSEKLRHVVKIGPMHLKGVWIPFERALDFANKEKITELLYPLFVHNIGALLYHPTNQNRTSQVMAVAAEQRRKQETAQMRGGPPGLPSLQQHHHHAIPLPGPPPPLSSHQQHPSMGRPAMDRTFPTPPTSASSIMGGVGANDNFQWSTQQQMSNGQGPPPISIDTGLSNGSMPDSHSARGPNTPATTPPGSNVQSMQNYPPVSQSYDSSRQMYQQSSQPQPPSYQSSNPPRQEQPPLYQGAYVKSEMGPPSSRPVGAGSEQADTKPPNGMMHSGQQENGSQHHAPEDEGEHEHEAEYTHDGGGYDANRGSYNYSVPPPAPISSDHSHIAPEISGSPHQAGSGRATPRTAPAPQAYYQSGYHTPPPRAGQQSSSVYSVISNDRGSVSGPSGSDGYASQSDMNGSLQNGYAPPPLMNGNSGGLKRGRDDEDDRPTSGGNGMGQDLKRRKTMLDGSSGSAPSPTPYNLHNPPMAQPAPAIAPQRRR